MLWLACCLRFFITSSKFVAALRSEVHADEEFKCVRSIQALEAVFVCVLPLWVGGTDEQHLADRIANGLGLLNLITFW